MANRRAQALDAGTRGQLRFGVNLPGPPTDRTTTRLSVHKGSV